MTKLWRSPVLDLLQQHFSYTDSFFVVRFEDWRGLLYLLDGSHRVQGANLLFITKM